MYDILARLLSNSGFKVNKKVQEVLRTPYYEVELTLEDYDAIESSIGGSYIINYVVGIRFLGNEVDRVLDTITRIIGSIETEIYNEIDETVLEFSGVRIDRFETWYDVTILYNVKMEVDVNG